MNLQNWLSQYRERKEQEQKLYFCERCKHSFPDKHIYWQGEETETSVCSYCAQDIVELWLQNNSAKIA